MQDSLLQLAVRRIEALEDLGLQTVWHSYRVDYQPLLILTTPRGQELGQGREIDGNDFK